MLHTVDRTLTELNTSPEEADSAIEGRGTGGDVAADECRWASSGTSSRAGGSASLSASVPARREFGAEDSVALHTGASGDRGTVQASSSGVDDETQACESPRRRSRAVAASPLRGERRASSPRRGGVRAASTGHGSGQTMPAAGGGTSSGGAAGVSDDAGTGAGSRASAAHAGSGGRSSSRGGTEHAWSLAAVPRAMTDIGVSFSRGPNQYDVAR